VSEVAAGAPAPARTPRDLHERDRRRAPRFPPGPGAQQWMVVVLLVAGVVSLVVDLDELVTDVEESNRGAPVRWAVRTAGRDDSGRVLLGDPSVFDSPAAIQDISVPDGMWEVAAVAGPELTPPLTRRSAALKLSDASAISSIFAAATSSSVIPKRRIDVSRIAG